MAYEFPLTNDLLTMVETFLKTSARALRQRAGISIREFRLLRIIDLGAADTAPELARAASVSGSSAAQTVEALASRGLLVFGDKEGRRTRTSLSVAGASALRCGREAIGNVARFMLSPCDSDQRNAFEFGCTVTAAMLSPYWFADSQPDKPSVYLESFLATEQSVIKTTHEFGLGLAAFRIVFELETSSEPLTATDVSHQLLLPKASVSEALRTLRGKGVVATVPLDGKAKRLELTETGRSLARISAAAVDDCMVNKIRAADAAERHRYVAAASVIADSLRNSQSHAAAHYR